MAASPRYHRISLRIRAFPVKIEVEIKETDMPHDHGHGHSHGHDHGAAGAAEVQAPSRFSGQIAITDKAAEKLKSLMETEKKDLATTALRIGVQGGGCSGLSYFMDFDTPTAEDKVFTHGGVKVAVDPRSILYLSGSILDYAEGLMGSGFSIKNPNVKGTCGCGSSFTT
jgi:iron-sulfur cluster assembly protein